MRNNDTMIAERPCSEEHEVIRKRALFALAFAVSLLVFALHLPSLQNQFVIWDDDLNVYQNQHIRSFDLHFLSWAFTDMSSGNWQPMTWISHAMDYAVWKLDPFGYHATNLFLHTINTFLAIWLIASLLTIRQDQKLTKSSSVLIVSGVSGLLFGCHPLRVEAVSWISCRTDLLCTLFYFMSLIAYSNYAREKTTAGRPKGGRGLATRWYIWSLAMFLLAAFSKPMAITLPAILLLIDWHPFGRFATGKDVVKLCLEKIPFIGLSAFVAIVTFLAEAGLGAITSFADVPLSSRLLVAVKALSTYVISTIWPYHLAPLYPYPKDPALFSGEYAAAVLLVAGITGMSIHFLRKQKFILFGWLYFLITLMPVLGIIKARPVYMADRYTYLPSLGLSLIAGLFALYLWDSVEKAHSKPRTVVVAALGLLVTAQFSYVTVRQTAIWKDTLSLWNYVIDEEGIKVPEAYNNRGSFFGEQGDCDRAISDFAMAISINSSDASAYGNMAVALECKGSFDRAMEYYNTAIRLNPSGHLLYFNRGILQGKMGMRLNAIEDYSRTLLLKPDFIAALLYRAEAYRETGQDSRALDDYQEACDHGSDEACKAIISYKVH